MVDTVFIREAIRRRDVVRGLGLFGASLLLQGCLTQGDVSQVVSLNSLQALTGLGGPDFTEEDEIQMGRTLYGPTIDQAGGAYENVRVQTAMQDFARPLFEASARPGLPWEIVVLDDSTVNAWALPGGKLGINRGLLRYVASEEELTAVLAHEMGHVEKSHAIEEIGSERFTKGLTDIGLNIAASQASSYTSRVPGGTELSRTALDALSQPLVRLVTSGYSRSNEFEADSHILAVFGKRGLEPGKSYTFFETLLRLVPAGSQRTTSLWSTHPETQARVDRLKESAEAAARTAPRATAGSDAYARLKRAFPTRYTPVDLPLPATS